MLSTYISLAIRYNNKNQAKYVISFALYIRLKFCVKQLFGRINLLLYCKYFRYSVKKATIPHIERFFSACLLSPFLELSKIARARLILTR